MLTGKPKYFENNLSTTRPTCTGLRSKSGRCGERPSTSDLLRATAKLYRDIESRSGRDVCVFP